MDVVVNKDKMIDVSLLPGMDSIPKNTTNLQGLTVPFNEEEEVTGGVEMKSSQTVVNEAPSSIQFSKANDSRSNRTEPQIKTTTVESTSQSQPADSSSSGGQFFSISSCISCIIILLIASAIAYYLYSNPDKLDKLMTKLPTKLPIKK